MGWVRFKFMGETSTTGKRIWIFFPLICNVNESKHSDESGTIYEMEAEERSCCSLAMNTHGQARNIPKLGCQLRSWKKKPPSPAPAWVSRLLSSLSHCAGVRQCIHSDPRSFLKISLQDYKLAAEIHHAENVELQNRKTVPLDSSSVARRTDNIFRY